MLQKIRFNPIVWLLGAIILAFGISFGVDGLYQISKPPPARVNRSSEIISQGYNKDGKEVTQSTVWQSVAKDFERTVDSKNKEIEALKKAVKALKKVTAGTVITSIHSRTYRGELLKDTTSLAIVSHYKKEGIFKPPIAVVTVTQLNDSSKTLAIQSFSLPPPRPKRFGIGLQAAYGTGLKNLKPEPFLGVGISYNLIRL